MPDIAGLPEALAIDITDDDYIPLFDNGAATNKSRKGTRANVMAPYPKNGAAMTPTTLTASVSVAAPAGAIDTLTVATGLVMGATLQKALTISGSITVPVISAGAEGSATITLTGANVGDQVIVMMPDTFPAGLIVARAVVSAPNTVKVYWWNAAGSPTTSASFTIRATALRWA